MVALNERLYGEIEAAKKTQEKLNELRLKTIPDFARSVGIDEIGVDGVGRTLISHQYVANLTDQNRAGAINWALTAGHGSIVKKKVEIEFDPKDKLDGKKFMKIIKYVEALELDHKATQTINAQTLKKFVRERIEKGDPDFNRKLFGVYEVRQIEIKGVKINKIKT